jgi:hypothetical protein
MPADAPGGKVTTSGRRPASSAGCFVGGAPGAVPGAAARIVLTRVRMASIGRRPAAETSDVSGVRAGRAIRAAAR